MATKKVAAKPAEPGAAAIETADRPEKIRNLALVGHSGAGKTTLVEALLAATGTIGRAGTIADGNTVSDHDPVEVAQQRSVALVGLPADLGQRHGQPARHPWLPGLHRRVARRVCGLPTARCSSSRRPMTSTRSPSRCGRNARRSAPRARSSSPSWTRRAPTIRRRSPAASRSSAAPTARPCCRCTCRSAAVRARHRTGSSGCCPARCYDYSAGFPPKESGSGSAEAAEPGSTPSGARGADRGDHQQQRGRDAARALPGRRGHRPRRAHRRPRDRGRPWHVLSRCCRSAPATGLGLAELLEMISGAFPSPAEMDLPAVTTPDGGLGSDLSCDPAGALLAQIVRTTHRPVSGPALRSCGSSPGRSPRTPRCTSPATAAPSGAIPTTTRTSGSARSTHRSARRCGRSRAPSPATSAPSAGSASPRPATRSRPRAIRC